MRKTSYLILVASILLTAISSLGWLAGLVVGQTFGGLIHLLLILAMFSSIGVLVGVILLVVSSRKK